MERLLLNANRNGYAPDQCGRTMTVGGGWWSSWRTSSRKRRCTSVTTVDTPTGQFGRRTLKAWRSSDSGLRVLG